ncbi:hypothetical protein LTR86_011230 [Recurvomyces mirabilis]|nr:hypothetical protein LTR86_011230 [Recurvomyces mirabilis]
MLHREEYNPEWVQLAVSRFPSLRQVFSSAGVSVVKATLSNVPGTPGFGDIQAALSWTSARSSYGQVLTSFARLDVRASPNESGNEDDEDNEDENEDEAGDDDERLQVDAQRRTRSSRMIPAAAGGLPPSLGGTEVRDTVAGPSRLYSQRNTTRSMVPAAAGGLPPNLSRRRETTTSSRPTTATTPHSPPQWWYTLVGMLDAVHGDESRYQGICSRYSEYPSDLQAAVGVQRAAAHSRTLDAVQLRAYLQSLESQTPQIHRLYDLYRRYLVGRVGMQQ